LVFFVAIVANKVKLFLYKLSKLAILLVKYYKVKLIFGKERFIVISVSCAIYAVVFKGANMLVYLSAIDKATGISNAFRRVIKALAS
jgi:hypothetical protein